MWIKFKRNVFIFTMIYWNHVKECAENYFFSGHAMEGIPFNLALANRSPWNISIPADSSHIHSSGVATPIALTWISSDVQHFMIAWIIACRGPLLWTLVINSWLILILSGWKRDRSNKPAKPAPKWSIATLIPAAFSDLLASANSSNRIWLHFQ